MARSTASRAGTDNGPAVRTCSRPPGNQSRTLTAALGGSPVTAVASRPARSVVSRRCAYSRTAAEARSSHGRSSTPTIAGASSARARITPRKATATARWSGGSGPGSARSSATSSARRCGPGSPLKAASATGSSRSPSAEKLSAASAWTGRQVSTCQPRSRAWSIPADHSVVLPMPASPSTSSAAGRSAASSRNRPIRASSAARPCMPTSLPADHSTPHPQAHPGSTSRFRHYVSETAGL